MNYKKLLFFLALYLAAISLTICNALAEIHQVGSLEWKTSQSPLILVGKVEKVKVLDSGTEETGVSFHNEEVTIKVLRHLVGSQAEKELTFSWKPTGADSAQNWQKKGYDILFFFTPNKNKTTEFTLADSASFVDLVTLEKACVLNKEKQKTLQSSTHWFDLYKRKSPGNLGIEAPRGQ